MKKLLFSILALSLSSVSAFGYCELKEGYTTLAIRPVDSDIRITIDKYNGEEIGSLKKGKKTYFVAVRNPSRSQFNYMPGKELTKKLRNKGYSDRRDFESQIIKIVTQNKGIVNRILAEKFRNTSLCTYGTEIVGHKPFNLKWSAEIEAEISTPDHNNRYNNRQQYYQVVDEVKKLPCSRPLVYTPEALEAYGNWGYQGPTPEFMGDKIGVMCIIDPFTHTSRIGTVKRIREMEKRKVKNGYNAY